MPLTTISQWVLLGCYLALLVWSAVIGWRIPRLRPIAVSAGALAVTHVAFYAAFLMWPGWLGWNGTMLFSIVIRFQVLFTITLGLALAVRRGRWR